jgi:hypothetical protein
MLKITNIEKEFIDQLNTSHYDQPADVFDIDEMDAIPGNYSHSFRDKLRILVNHISISLFLIKTRLLS